ncbi:MAG TPA: UDP-N-acetylmuramyl-tripeptide synthetase [Patescibacteria group bacterium]|nr:UDP-N-acetylmuramyl-tripeptide synthetase [Patescibacteria group bacterium]
MIKRVLKKWIPTVWISFYHKCLSQLAAVVYGFPSQKMIIIGVTGTKGKSSTSNILWKILTDAGHTVGLTGTLNYRIGHFNTLSPYKMTMLGRFKLQQWLHRMVKAGCDIAIIETTSEGIKQWRHLGIAYDIVTLTNLTPEHIESHGGFEQYKQAKQQLFWHIAHLHPKQIRGHIVPRASVVNMDAEYANEFSAIGGYQKVHIGSTKGNTLMLSDIAEELQKTNFVVNGSPVSLPLLGSWNVLNATVAMGVGFVLGISLTDMIQSIQTVDQIPGRMEFIDEGQPFTVIVDYAYEPRSLGLLYHFWREKLGFKHRIITLISSTGGGRDVARRRKNGYIAGSLCDMVIVTNEDPYDDNPQAIIDEVAVGVSEAGKIEGTNMWRILNRREAIGRAFQFAQPGDVVLLTAKGAELSICVAQGKKIPWDDRAVAREELRDLENKKVIK